MITESLRNAPKLLNFKVVINIITSSRELVHLYIERLNDKTAMWQFILNDMHNIWNKGNLIAKISFWRKQDKTKNHINTFILFIPSTIYIFQIALAFIFEEKGNCAYWIGCVFVYNTMYVRIKVLASLCFVCCHISCCPPYIYTWNEEYTRQKWRLERFETCLSIGVCVFLEILFVYYQSLSVCLNARAWNSFNGLKVAPDYECSLLCKQGFIKKILICIKIFKYFSFI